MKRGTITEQKQIQLKSNVRVKLILVIAALLKKYVDQQLRISTEFFATQSLRLIIVLYFVMSKMAKFYALAMKTN